MKKVKVYVEGKYVKSVNHPKSKIYKFPVLERLSRKIHNKILSQ